MLCNGAQQQLSCFLQRYSQLLWNEMIELELYWNSFHYNYHYYNFHLKSNLYIKLQLLSQSNELHYTLQEGEKSKRQFLNTLDIGLRWLLNHPEIKAGQCLHFAKKFLSLGNISEKWSLQSDKHMIILRVLCWKDWSELSKVNKYYLFRAISLEFNYNYWVNVFDLISLIIFLLIFK